MARVYVSIGSNIDKEKNTLSSVMALREHFVDLDISNVYESQAVGFEGNDFHNLVVGFDTDQSPLDISNILKQIEADHDRTRGKEKFESRTLDLDQLLYGDLVMQMEGVNIPHPDILRYNFVLKPLTELAGEVEHPEEEKTINELWEEFEEQGEMKVVEYTFE
ncbi:MAG: 2-amino-4-hydroxy-6-hydroxymethyldihydropteridine diphosphokinase [Gammaproteobacteria bacterium]